MTYNIESTELILFIPPVEPDEVVWSGLPLSPSEALEIYDVDKVLTTAELNVSLASYSRSENPMTVFAIPEQVSEHVTFLAFGRTEFFVLKK